MTQKQKVFASIVDAMTNLNDAMRWLNQDDLTICRMSLKSAESCIRGAVKAALQKKRKH